MNPRRSGSWLRRAVLPLCVGYAAALVLLLLIFQLGGDRWWWASLFHFAPRWIWGAPALPLLFLVLASPRGGRRNLTLGLLALGAGLLVGPILGFVLTPTALLPGGPGDPTRRIRVFTGNVARDAANGPGVTRAIAAADPDVVVLQEWADWIVVAWPAGWRVVRPGPELLIASRLPLEEAAVATWPDPPGEPVNMALAVLRTAFGQVHLVSLHLTSPRAGLGAMASRRTLVDFGQAPTLERMLAARLEESRSAATWSRSMLPAPLLVAGDFNMPDDSWIFRQTWQGFTNAFRTAGVGFGATVNAAIGPLPVPARIDHQLGGPGWRCRGARIGRDMGSDHHPLVVDWEWTGAVPAPESVPPAVESEVGPPRVDENFEGVPPGGLPAGWGYWRNGRLARAAVIRDAGGRGGVLALDTEDSGADVRVWTAGPEGDAQEFQVDLLLDTLNPIRILIGGADFATRVPSARGLELIRGLQARLLAVEPDSARELARVRSRQWQETDWLRITLRTRGAALAARVVRLADGAWLNPEGEWVSPPAGWTLSATGLPATLQGGLAGIWRVASYTGPILSDRWELSEIGLAEPDSGRVLRN